MNMLMILVVVCFSSERKGLGAIWMVKILQFHSPFEKREYGVGYSLWLIWVVRAGVLVTVFVREVI